MLDEAIKAKLRDPAYLDLHLLAAASIHTIGVADWYDSQFLRRFEVAKHFLAQVRPDAFERFVRGFDSLLPPPGFDNVVLDELFDDQTRANIIDVTRSAMEESLNEQSRWELKEFGRRVIWDHPFFLQLQRDLLPRMNELAGCPLVPGYNFLSLYAGEGVCRPHIDHPNSMYTLDYCIEQSDQWPIHFSKVVDWPTPDTMRKFSSDEIKNRADLNFRPYVLQPNQALFFNGSSQWHYRDSISPGGFCNLLFFHYFPAGTEGLIDPLRWAGHFDIPELQVLVDLFEREDFSKADDVAAE